ncbi:hypothetical protein GCM10009642_05110 [Nocardiopsis metallicus]
MTVSSRLPRPSPPWAVRNPALVTAALVVSLLLPSANASSDSRPAVSDPPGTGAPAVGETLLPTGDTVRRLPESGAVSVDPGEGRDGTRFTTVRLGDRSYVLPSDVHGSVSAAEGAAGAYELTEGAPAPLPSADRGCGEGREACHSLTVHHTGPDGETTDEAASMVFGLDEQLVEFGADAAEVRFDLPEGRYMLVTDITDFDDPDADWHRLVRTLLVLDGDTELRMDATTTRPVGTVLGDPRAEAVLVEVGVGNRTGAVPVSVSLRGDDFSGLYTAGVEPDEGTQGGTEGLTSFVASTWAHPNTDGSYLGSPSTYHLLDTIEGSFPTGYDRTVEPEDLASVTAEHLSQTPGNGATKAIFGTAPGVDHTATLFLPHALPSSTTHLLEPGDAEWSSAFGENRENEAGRVEDVTALGSVARSYEAGHQYEERWNAAVVGPMFLWSEHAVRTGNELWFGMPMYSDQDMHQGGSRTDSASIRLYQDGGLVAESETGHLSAELLPGTSELRLESRTSRPSVSDLSTRVEAAWTVASTEPGAEPQRLPLWVVRYQPEVDEWNSAHARGVLRLPLSVDSQPGSAAGTVEELTIESSTDDGRTWEPARVVPHGTGAYTAIIRLPRHGAEYLSLRAGLTDSDGNSLEQTIERALRLAG